MGRTIASLAVSLGLNSQGFNRGIDDAGKKAGGFRRTLGTVAKGVGLAAGAVTAAGGALLGMASQTSAAADEIDKASTRIGITTDAYQEMAYWASQNGIEQGTMERAVGRLNQRIGLAAEGNEKYSNALKNLGVDMEAVTEGTLSTEDAMAQSIQALSQMENEQKKSAMASELFGTKMARDLMPALQDGSLSIEEAAKQAEELGLIMSEDAIDANVKFQDSMDQIKSSLRSAFMQTMTQVLPILQRFLDWVLDHMPQIQATIQTVMEVVSRVVEKAFTVFDEYVLPVLGEVFSWIKENLPAMQSQFSGTFETIQNIITTFVEIVIVFWERWGETIWSIATWLFETLTSLIDSALTIIEGILEVFIGVFTGDFDRMSDGVMTIWDGLMDALVKAISALIDAAFDWGKDIVLGLAEGIKNMAMAPVRAMGDVAKGIGESIVGFFGVRSPSRLMMEYGKNITEGLQRGIDSVKVDYPLPDVAGSITSRNEVVHRHEGKLVIEGVNDAGQFVDSVQVLMDNMRREVRT